MTATLPPSRASQLTANTPLMYSYVRVRALLSHPHLRLVIRKVGAKSDFQNWWKSTGQSLRILGLLISRSNQTKRIQISEAKTRLIMRGQVILIPKIKTFIVHFPLLLFNLILTVIYPPLQQGFQLWTSAFHFINISLWIWLTVPGSLILKVRDKGYPRLKFWINLTKIISLPEDWDSSRKNIGVHIEWILVSSAIFKMPSLI